MSAMFDWLTFAVYFQGKLLGIEWHPWKLIGWLGNICFFSRFLVQWYATERRQQITIPSAFWWLSLVGSLFLLSYALVYQQDSVFIFANAFNWIPYLRNLVIHHRQKRASKVCGGCQTKSPGHARYCLECGSIFPTCDSPKGIASPNADEA